MQRVSKRRLLGWLLAPLIATATLAAIWSPVALRYWLTPLRVDPAAVQAHRETPADEVLAAIAEQSLTSDNPIAGERTIALADGYLAGRFEYPLFGPIDVTPQFAPDDLAKGSDVVQFLSAAWTGPDWLLRAYELTKREPYFEAALSHAVNFIDFEAGLWLPRASIWATNSLAARVSVLTRLWRVYRVRKNFDPAIAVRILQHASRTAELLARPAAFVGVSNHGVMQNIGLLQIATAFPQLPDSARFARTALERLAEQMRFYVSDEGVVLEHSAGYHFSGLRLLSYVRELHELRGAPMPQEWIAKQQGALAFFRFLERPDRTLPMFGNTLSMPWALPVRGLGTGALPDAAYTRAPASLLRPVSGYAAWWDARTASGRTTLAQTVVPWSNFAGHAHKLADEMSLLLWADGQSWLTNVGYSPYHGELADKAAGWDGSSAPHFVGEQPGNPRSTTLRAFVDDTRLRALDLERVNGDGSRIRRQVVTAGARWWIVLDTAAANTARTLCTQWTTYPGTRVTPTTAVSTERASFALAREGAAHTLALHLASGGAGEFQQLQGSVKPYAGWAVIDRRPTATQSFRVTTASANWLLTVFALDANPTTPTSLSEVAVMAPDQWRVTLQVDGAPLTVTRNANGLVHANGTLTLQPGPDASAARATIRAAFSAVREKYPRVRDRLQARWLASGATIAGVAVLMIALVLPAVRARRRLRAAMHAAYIAGCGWLVFGFLG